MGGLKRGKNLEERVVREAEQVVQQSGAAWTVAIFDESNARSGVDGERRDGAQLFMPSCMKRVPNTTRAAAAA